MVGKRESSFFFKAQKYREEAQTKQVLSDDEEEEGNQIFRLEEDDQDDAPDSEPFGLGHLKFPIGKQQPPGSAEKESAAEDEGKKKEEGVPARKPIGFKLVQNIISQGRLKEKGAAQAAKKDHDDSSS